MMMILVQTKRKGNFEYVNVEFTHTYNYPTHMVADNKCYNFHVMDVLGKEPSIWIIA